MVSPAGSPVGVVGKHSLRGRWKKRLPGLDGFCAVIPV
jgi:hypothetical protein